MLRFATKYHGFKASLIWWPDSFHEIVSAFDMTPVVILWQCPVPLVEQVKQFVCWKRSFQTPLIDLSRSEEELWQRLEPKSCRYEIRKGRKLDYEITCNEDLEAARILINESIQRLAYRQELGTDEWNDLRQDHDIYLCKSSGTAIAAHVIMKDFPGRVKLTLSGTADRDNPTIRHLIGPLNRLLHWTEITDYKGQGISIYDFGGINPDKNSIDYPIGQFKLTFGAEVVSEPILYIAKNPLVRMALKTFGSSRNILKRVPWPEKLRRVVRTNSRLSDLFR